MERGKWREGNGEREMERGKWREGKDRDKKFSGYFSESIYVSIYYFSRSNE